MPRLSDRERAQLGTGNFVDAGQWADLRNRLVDKSMALNPLLTDPEMTAYTPGETAELLTNQSVLEWHEEVSQFAVPDKYGTLVLVPCAKTKPWDEASTRRSSLYRAYHKIIDLSDKGEIGPVYFATVSEPLGIVPQGSWTNFPQYDNPGLFRDDYLRTGMVKADWLAEYGAKKSLPFDEEKYQHCIRMLGSVIAKFLAGNAGGKKVLAFVDNPKGISGSHQDMLDYASSLGSVTITRFLKREQARTEPTDYILSKLPKLVASGDGL